jgi:hypothetical protein
MILIVLLIASAICILALIGVSWRHEVDPH